MAIKRPLSDRFWEKVDKRGPNECWDWTATANGWGYGQIHYDGDKMIGAHRASYIIHHGPIPDGMNVLHKCDNPLCVNPSHLFLGTNAANVADKVSKNRQSRLPGENNPRSRLSSDDVVSIRRTYAEGRVSQNELSKEFGVHQSVISAIVRGESWQHVHGPITRSGKQIQPTKMTPEIVLEIRALFATGTVTQKELATRYGVMVPHISRIINRKRWKHI